MPHNLIVVYRGSLGNNNRGDGESSPPASTHSRLNTLSEIKAKWRIGLEYNVAMTTKLHRITKNYGSVR